MSVYAYRRFQLRPLMRRGRKIREESCEEVVLRGWEEGGGGLLLVVAGYTNLNTAFFYFGFPPTSHELN